MCQRLWLLSLLALLSLTFVSAKANTADAKNVESDNKKSDDSSGSKGNENTETRPKFHWHNLTSFEDISLYSDAYVHDVYHSGLRKFSMKADTLHCRNNIEFEMMKYVRAMLEETPYPFEEVMYHSQCESAWYTHPPMLPIYMKEVPPKPLIPPHPARVNGTLDAESLSILYVILAHDHVDFAKKLVDALNEPQHTFVFHVDKKAPKVYQELKEFAANYATANVFVMDEGREDMIWGGFSIVNGTLNAMRYAWTLSRHFDYMSLLSGTHYPIKSNRVIRETLAKQPNAIYMDVHNEPNRPGSDMWHHYVECDGKLHRINRLALLRGMNMHVGSQWFIIPRHLVDWYIHNPLPFEYTYYAQYVVVADENYFQTLSKNSPYCDDIVNKNYLFVLFDKWENERHETRDQRDPRKCLHPDPDQCGRSPTTLTRAFKNLLKISRALFARKFDPKNEESMLMLEMIDRWRQQSDSNGGSGSHGDEGVEIMIRQKGGQGSPLTMESTTSPSSSSSSSSSSTGIVDRCLEFRGLGQPVHFVPCDPRSPQQWLTLGPCTDGANVTLLDGGCPLPSHGEDESYCQLQSSSRNLCLDISGENPNNGAHIIAWECTGQWNQLFRLGSNCSITAVQPDLIGRVRGYQDTNVTKCLEINHEGLLVTGDCASPSLVLNISSSMDPHEAMKAIIEVREKLVTQQFQYVKKEGHAVGQYWEALNVTHSNVNNNNNNGNDRDLTSMVNNHNSEDDDVDNAGNDGNSGQSDEL